jgi:hypothetical protein
MPTRPFLTVMATLVILGLSCSGPFFAAGPTPVDQPPAQEATATLIVTPTDAATPVPSDTPLPTETPTITPTPTPSVVTVTPLDKDVICRFGPSDLFSTEAAFKVGQMALVLGTDAGGGWWYIENPSKAGRFCWVSAALTKIEGNPLGVAIHDPPIPFVEGVSVGMDPKNASITCGMFPYTFGVSFKITANGPTTVTFVRSKSNGSSGGPETVTFTKSGTKVFDDSYAVGGPGDYWFKVSVTSPNKISGQGSAAMGCTP